MRHAFVPARAFSARTQPAPPDRVGESETVTLADGREPVTGLRPEGPDTLGVLSPAAVHAPSSAAPPAASTARRDADREAVCEAICEGGVELVGAGSVTAEE